MSQLVKKGKLYVDILFKPEVMKSFEMHRDLKSCIQLTEAEEILSKRQQEFLKSGTTAVLQFLNSYPLSFNFKVLSISLRMYAILKKMEGLKGYEQQLRYGLYSKLREYLASDQQKKMMVTNIQEQQRVILQQIKVEPYDIVHSINFLFLQKEGLKSEIFYHCIDVLRETDYKILESSLPKITPMLLRRLHLSEWGYLRQFKHFLDFLVYNYQPLKEASIKLGFLNLLPIAQLQLHRVGYSKIPRCIDEIITQICHNLESDNNLDTSLIQTTFWAFKHLPINYNQKAFRLLYVKLLERVGQNKRVFHANKLPFIRMKFSEIKQIYQKHFNSVDIFSQIPYIGNDLEVRHWMRKTGVINKLLKQYKKFKQIRQKHYSINVIICHLLLQEFEHNKQEFKQIEHKYLQVMGNIEQNNTPNYLFKTLSLCHIFQIEQISKKLNLKYAKRRYDYYFQEFIKRQFQFDQIQFMDNINQAIEMFHNTNAQTIIQWINILISKVLFGNFKFNFKFFSQYIFLLEKSNNSDAFKSAKEMVYSRLQPQDSPYLVQLYLRFPNKTIKGHINFMTKIWQKQKSFKSLGKFLTMSTYGLFSSPRGQLNLKIKSILQDIQPSLNQQDVAFFMLDQYISILRFLHHFRSFLPTFSSKFLNIVLNMVQKMVISKEQSKQMLVFLQECILLNIESVMSSQNSQRILKILLNLKQNFKQSMFMKCKQMQMRWMLGFTEDADKVALTVQQILQNILNSNNAPKKVQIILILLKLYTFQIIDLSKKMSQQLAKFAIKAINQDSKNVKDVINTIHLISKQNSRVINPQKAQNLLMVIKSAVKNIKTKHNFQYYGQLIQIAKQSRDNELLKLCFDQLSVFDIRMYPSQIKKILHILKYYPFIQVTNFREKIIKEVYNFVDYLQDQLPDILYTAHTLRDIVPKHQAQIYEKLMQRSQHFLLEKITKSSKSQKSQTSTELKKDHLLLILVKNLWVSVKINQYSNQSLKLFQFVKERHTELIKMKELQGLTWQYIYYIHYVFEIKSKSYQSKKNVQKKAQPQKKFFFKSKNIPKQVQTQPFKNQKKLKALFKVNSFTIQKPVTQNLEKLGLQEVNSEKIAPNQTNFYTCNYQIKGITLPIFVKKQERKCGLIILSDNNFFNDCQEKRGKVQFLVNAYTAITQIPVFAILPTENFALQ